MMLHPHTHESSK